jgi:hypothetical protein
VALVPHSTHTFPLCLYEIDEGGPTDANKASAGRQWEEMWENDDYENEYYYVSQLFELNWQPRVMG